MKIHDLVVNRFQRRIKLWQAVLLIISIVIVTVGIIMYRQANHSTQPQPTSTIDMPYLTPQEAIAIAQQEAANLEYNIVAALARSSSRGWRATYIGGGKWTADFYYGANIYRWTVFEKNLTAVYIGAFARH